MQNIISKVTKCGQDKIHLEKTWIVLHFNKYESVFTSMWVQVFIDLCELNAWVLTECLVGISAASAPAVLSPIICLCPISNLKWISLPFFHFFPRNRFVFIISGLL